MNWISALGPWQWALMAAVPPAVLMLYFLKLRRTSIEVPSTFLWKRAVEDMHVNSIWQRLRQNLLLYLQMAFLAALIIACLRPGLNGSSQVGRRTIFLVDNSASMQATDLQPSRLEVAKQRVRQELESMNRNDVAMLLAFSDRADVRQGFTSDKQRLLAALKGIEPTNRLTDLSEALRAASGLANPGRASFNGVNDVPVGEAKPAKLAIYTDGGFNPIGEFDLGNLSAEYIPIGDSTVDNVGIVAFSVQRNDERPEQIEAFARIANSGDLPVSLTVSLYKDQNLLDATNAKIEPGKETAINFTVRNLSEGGLRLEIDRSDSFLIDNTAFAALRPQRQLSLLLVTPGNYALMTSVSTGPIKRLADVRIEKPEYIESPEYAAKITSDAFDLIIFDQCTPQKLPAANTLFIGVQPPGEQWKLGEPQGPAFILDVDRSHPIMQYLEMGAVEIIEGRTVRPPEGGTSLMTADIGSVMAIAPRGPYQDAVLGFKIVTTNSGEVEVNTNWANRRSFPVFVYAAVEYLGGGITTAAAPTVQPGQSIGLTLSNRFDQFRIQDPAGNETKVERGGQTQLVFSKTEKPGIYRVYGKDRDQPLELFSVNLFSNRESQLSAAQDIQLGTSQVQASVTTTIGRKEYWRWLLAGGLVLLMLEWVVYSRRVFV